MAGIREILPIHQVSRIFYATTGKILGVESGGGANTPVLLLKRDANTQPPRIVKQANDSMDEWDDYEEHSSNLAPEQDEEDDDYDLNQQFHRESSVVVPDTPEHPSRQQSTKPWTLPPNLDPEWLALGVYPEEEEESDSEDDFEPEQDANEDSPDADLPASFSALNLEPVSSSSPPGSSPPLPSQRPAPPPTSTNTPGITYPNIRSSLSLLEMLIRLTSLQQYQQASHLTIPDEVLTFFLEDSSSTGAAQQQGGRMMRNAAIEKLKFDPYNESPIKRHGEDYQYQNGQGGEQGDWGGQHGDWDRYSRGGTPDDAGFRSSPRRSLTPQRSTPQPWLSRNGMGSRQNSPLMMRQGQSPSSPVSPYQPKKVARPVERVQQQENKVKGSPLGRAESVDTESA